MFPPFLLSFCHSVIQMKLFIPLFLRFFFLSSFQTLTFLSHFSQELWGLEDWNLVPNVDSGLMYLIYRNQASAAYSSHYFIIFLSLQLSNIKNFCHIIFSGTVRSRRLKLGTHVDSGQMYHVYRNQAAAYLSFISSFFFLSNFQTLKFFITLFSRTARPRRLKLGTHMDSGQMYCVYRNQAAAAYWSPYFFIFFLSNFQTLKFFAHFYQQLWGLEGWNLVHIWTRGECMVYTRIRLLLHTCEPSRIIREPPRNGARHPHSYEWDRTSQMWKSKKKKKKKFFFFFFF